MAIITPILLDKSAYGAYFLFGGLAILNTIVFAAYMPETRGRSLEDIQDSFQGPLLRLKSLSHYTRPLVSGLRKRDGQAAAWTGQGLELSYHGSASRTFPLNTRVPS